MTRCEKCGAPMAAVLKRAGGQSKLVYECPVCGSDKRKGARPQDHDRA